MYHRAPRIRTWLLSLPAIAVSFEADRLSSEPWNNRNQRREQMSTSFAGGFSEPGQHKGLSGDSEEVGVEPRNHHDGDLYALE